MDIQRPEIDFPGGAPSAELQITDIWEGDGAQAQPGDTVKVHYVGVAYSTGEEFDASYNRGQPLDFPLGAGRVIAVTDALNRTTAFAYDAVGNRASVTDAKAHTTRYAYTAKDQLATNFGQPQSELAYQTPRTVRLSVGVRF